MVGKFFDSPPTGFSITGHIIFHISCLSTVLIFPTRQKIVVLWNLTTITETIKQRERRYLNYRLVRILRPTNTHNREDKMRRDKVFYWIETVVTKEEDFNIHRTVIRIVVLCWMRVSRDVQIFARSQLTLLLSNCIRYAANTAFYTLLCL